MANVTACLDCGGSVSDSACACPHCGTPLRLYSQAKRTHRRSEEAGSIFSLLFIFAVLGGIIYIFRDAILLIFHAVVR